MKTYIHYGSDRFAPELFSPPSNRFGFNKPNGGLWASAVDAEYGWKEWSIDNGWCLKSLKKSFTFRLKENANIIVINTVADVAQLPLQDDTEGLTVLKPIDFERLVEDGVDAIEVTLTNDSRLYYELYGWDCDCILVLNPDIIEEV